MQKLITAQGSMFLISLFLGMAMVFTYDFLRCLRRIISHNTFFIGVEDLLFWIIWSFIIIYHVHTYNSGILRWYIPLGMVVGATVYLVTLSRIIMFLVSRIISAFKKYAKKINKMLKNSVKQFRM